MPLNDDSDLAQLKRPIQRLGRRLALLRALKALEIWGIIPLAWWIAAPAVSAFWPGFAVSHRGSARLLGALILSFVAYRVALAAARGPGLRTLGLRIDRAYGPEDRLTNALCFAMQASPSRPRSALLPIAVASGVSFAKTVDNSRIASLRFRHFGKAAILTLLCLTALFLFAGGPRKRHLLRTTARGPEPADLATALPEDLQAIKSRLSNLARFIEDPDTAGKANRLLSLVRSLETGNVRRTAALGELARLTRELKPAEPMDAESGGSPSLRTLGAILSKDPVTHSLGRALSSQSLSDAQQALEALQHRLSDPRRKLDPADLARLRHAIEEQQKEHARQAAEARARLSALEERLQALAKAEQHGNLAPGERDEKHQLEHELEHLDRKRTRQNAASAALSALDRELASVSGKLARLLDDKPPLFSSLKQELTAAEAGEATEAQKRQLLAELRALEEPLQNSPGADALRQATVDRFRNRASGGDRAGDGSRHEPRGPRGTGASVDADGPGAGKSATLTSNPLGRTLWVSQETERAAAEAGPEATTLAGAGSGKPREGSFHDPNLRGEPTEVTAESAQDTTALTTARGADATVSAEAVSVAAQRGFSSQRYAPVYHAYAQVKEAWLEQPEVPAQRRTQVRRYFEFIRPRP